MRVRGAPVTLSPVVGGFPAHPGRVLAVAGVALLLPLLPSPAAADDATTMLVTFSSPAALDASVADGGSLDRVDDRAEELIDRVAQAELTAGEAAALAASPDVVAVEPEQWAVAADQPDDTCYATPALCPPAGAWHVNAARLPAAWDLSHGIGATIAILDGGLPAVTPSDLVGKVESSTDETGGQPRCDHGTEVATTAAAVTDNGFGVPGAGWDVHISSIQVLSESTNPNTNMLECGGGEGTIIRGINAAVTQGVDVINLSLTFGGSQCSSGLMGLQTAINSAIASGVVVVAAAGNFGQTTGNRAFAPASCTGVIGVGATQQSGGRASFSNFGPGVDLYAPGSRIPAYDGSNVFQSVDGTSFSAPIVSGVVALLRSFRDTLTPAEIGDILVRTSRAVPGTTGGVQLDAGRALAEAAFAGRGTAADVTFGGSTVLLSTDRNNAVRMRTGDGTTWSPWNNLGGAVLGDPAVAASPNSAAAEVFFVAADGSMRWRHSADGTRFVDPAVPLGGRFTSSPSAVSFGSSAVVFGRGLDGAVWANVISGGVANGWQSVGGNILGAPAATTWGSGRIDLFARGTNNVMYHQAFQGGWLGWESLGGGFTADPGAASWDFGRVDVVGRGLDGAVWHAAWLGTRWSGWEPLGGSIVAGPDATTTAPGRLEIYARAADAAIWVRRWTGSAWTGWSPTA